MERGSLPGLDNLQQQCASRFTVLRFYHRQIFRQPSLAQENQVEQQFLTFVYFGKLPLFVISVFLCGLPVFFLRFQTCFLARGRALSDKEVQRQQKSAQN
jgi:hypothetical protein